MAQCYSSELGAAVSGADRKQCEKKSVCLTQLFRPFLTVSEFAVGILKSDKKNEEDSYRVGILKNTTKKIRQKKYDRGNKMTESRFPLGFSAKIRQELCRIFLS